MSGKSGLYPANGQGHLQAAQAPFALAHCQCKTLSSLGKGKKGRASWRRYSHAVLCTTAAVTLCCPSAVGLPVLGEQPWCPVPGKASGIVGWGTPWLCLTHHTVYSC